MEHFYTPFWSLSRDFFYTMIDLLSLAWPMWYRFKNLRLSKRVSCGFFFSFFVFGKEFQTRWLVMHLCTHSVTIYLASMWARTALDKWYTMVRHLPCLCKALGLVENIDQYTQLQYCLLKSKCRVPESV